jgi:hypothetical protein
MNLNDLGISGLNDLDLDEEDELLLYEELLTDDTVIGPAYAGTTAIDGAYAGVAKVQPAYFGASEIAGAFDGRVGVSPAYFGGTEINAA